MYSRLLKRALRAAAFCTLLVAATCGREPYTEQPYEDPADCRCRVVRGKRVCNSACPGL